MSGRRGRYSLLALAAGLGVGCAGAPWFLGEPLDGRPAIPPTSRAETVADHRRKLEEARRRAEKVVELAELEALERRGALHASDVRQFADLLKERARDWVALRRPIPLARDLRHIIDLEPGRTRGLRAALRNAERAAGDQWLALGDNSRAEEEYRRAERHGATGMVFRLRAAWGASPADLDTEVLERALQELPERVLGPFAAAYLAGGGARPLLIQRAWTAARVYGPPELKVRIEALPVAATFRSNGGVPPSGPDDGGSRSVPVGKSGSGVEPAGDDYLYRGPTVARALLPLVHAFPGLLEPGARSRGWGERLLDEDPTSPDSLEVAALIDARAGRAEGAARKLGDLVFYSPDRAVGHARAARVWETAGEDRRACQAWQRATRVGAEDDPRWCDLLACLRRTPAAGDAVAVARHVRQHAGNLACAGGVDLSGSRDAGPSTAEDGGSADAAAAVNADADADSLDAVMEVGSDSPDGGTR